MCRSQYVRFRSTTPNAQGVHVGVFALANGLARAGVLSDDEYAHWRRSNDWFEAAYPEPTATDPSAYDRSVNPGAVAWFKLSAVHLIERTELYAELLDAHQVAWERVETSDPGRIVHEDDVQVIAVPRPGETNGSSR
ncbi:hypothetical protein IT072_18575 [Leifsonia sp. ZF2019]|nr:hypothetical protein IT072_18575 [Leifsonia sp. ZF2019]